MTHAAVANDLRHHDWSVWVPWLLCEFSECVLLGTLVWVLSWLLPLAWPFG